LIVLQDMEIKDVMEVGHNQLLNMSEIMESHLIQLTV